MSAWTKTCAAFLVRMSDPADVVERKSAGSGHRRDVGCAAQLVIQYNAEVRQLVKDPPRHPQQLPVGPCEGSPSPARRGAQSC